jgi:hypothetical protein
MPWVNNPLENRPDDLPAVNLPGVVMLHLNPDSTDIITYEPLKGKCP